MATFNWGTLFFFNKALFTFSFFRKVKFNKVWVWIAECILLTTQLCKAEVTGLFKTQYLPWVQWNKARLKSGVCVCVCWCLGTLLVVDWVRGLCGAISPPLTGCSGLEDGWRLAVICMQCAGRCLITAVCREVSYQFCTALQCQQYICRNVTVVQDDIIFLSRVKGGVEVVKISNIEHKIV